MIQRVGERSVQGYLAGKGLRDSGRAQARHDTPAGLLDLLLQVGELFDRPQGFPCTARSTDPARFPTPASPARTASRSARPVSRGMARSASRWTALPSPIPASFGACP